MVMFHKYICVIVAFWVVFLQKTISTGMGRCPKIKYLDDFNLTRFTGRWYEIERSFYIMQVISSCVSVDLTENTRGQLEVDVKTKSRWSGSFTVSEGVASQTKRHPSLLNYKVVSQFPKIISRYFPGAGFYQVLDTDYDSFAVLWSCTTFGFLHTDMLWIWSRKNEINASRRIEIYKMLDRLRLDSERLILPRNNNCTD